MASHFILCDWPIRLTICTKYAHTHQPVNHFIYARLSDDRCCAYTPFSLSLFFSGIFGVFIIGDMKQSGVIVYGINAYILHLASHVPLSCSIWLVRWFQYLYTVFFDWYLFSSELLFYSLEHILPKILYCRTTGKMTLKLMCFIEVVFEAIFFFLLKSIIYLVNAYELICFCCP